MTEQTTLTPKTNEDEEFFNAIIKDITQVPILLLSKRGHGKSSALKTIIKRCKESNQNITVKVFDVSMSWFKASPTKYRQLVTVDKIRRGEVVNINDCTYEMGMLTEAQRRQFVATIIGQDYQRAYDMKLNDEEAFKRLPWVVFLLEEANTYFSSFSFRQKDKFSPILSDFISVGRNYKLSAFMVVTAEQGELSPSIRRRLTRIYGRLEAEEDVAKVRKKNRAVAEYLSNEIPRFNFMYAGDRFYGPVKVPDEVKTPAQDYVMQGDEAIQTQGKGSSWLMQFLISFGITTFALYMFLSYFKVI